VCSSDLMTPGQYDLFVRRALSESFQDRTPLGAIFLR
jgi:hypothetical protein